MEINDNLMFIAAELALLELVLLVLMFRFFIRARRRNIEKYNQPLNLPVKADPAA